MSHSGFVYRLSTFAEWFSWSDRPFQGFSFSRSAIAASRFSLIPRLSRFGSAKVNIFFTFAKCFWKFFFGSVSRLFKRWNYLVTPLFRSPPTHCVWECKDATFFLFLSSLFQNFFTGLFLNVLAPRVNCRASNIRTNYPSVQIIFLIF